MNTLAKLTGYSCVVLAVVFVFQRGSEPQVLLASLFFAAACFIDTLKSKIPNLLNASLAVAGLAFNYWTAGTSGLVISLLGILAGLALLLVPYLMGGFGAGDVKALAALGALVGPGPIFQIFMYMALYGGLLAVIHYLSNRDLKVKLLAWWHTLKAVALTNDPQLLQPQSRESLRFPYAVAIALGYYTWLLGGDLL